METRYTYRPLRDPKNIRVLILQPSDSLIDPLIGTLQEIHIEKAQYTALSYCWAMENGDCLPSKSLILDDINVPIGENLRDALRRLRENASQPVCLWADALCINQLDDVEKSVQVAMMGDIYKTAGKVVAWLGEGVEDENKAAYEALQCLVAEYALPEPEGWFAADAYWHDEESKIPPWLLQHDWIPLRERTAETV